LGWLGWLRAGGLVICWVLSWGLLLMLGWLGWGAGGVVGRRGGWSCWGGAAVAGSCVLAAGLLDWVLLRDLSAGLLAGGWWGLLSGWLAGLVCCLGWLGWLLAGAVWGGLWGGPVGLGRCGGGWGGVLAVVAGTAGGAAE